MNTFFRSLARRFNVVTRLLALPPVARPLLVTVCMQAIGFGTLTALGAIYFTRTLGFTALQIGGGMSLAAMLGSSPTLPAARTR